MESASIIGVGMTKFGKFIDRTLKDLSREAVENALADAGISKEQIQAAYVGNQAAGIVTGQHCLRGQVVLTSSQDSMIASSLYGWRRSTI